MRNMTRLGAFFAAMSFSAVSLAAGSGAPCKADYNCVGEEICDSGKCTIPERGAAAASGATTPSSGGACATDNDCLGDAVCEAGTCKGGNAAAASGTTEASASTSSATPTGTTAASAPESAGTSKYPVLYGKRPLTLPRMMLSPELSFGALNISLGPFGSATLMNLKAGAEFGITDDFQVDAAPLAFLFGDASGYGLATVGATYRFVRSDSFEVGARALLGFTDSPDLVFTVGAPMRAHLVEGKLRLDTGAYLSVIAPNGGDAQVGLAQIERSVFSPAPGIPLVANFSILEQLYAGLNTGFGIFDFANAGDSVFVPLGFQAGYTITSQAKPVVDVGASFGFPLMFGSDGVVTELWTLGLAGKGYFEL
jgi:hypothetical protein